MVSLAVGTGCDTEIIIRFVNHRATSHEKMVNLTYLDILKHHQSIKLELNSINRKKLQIFKFKYQIFLPDEGAGCALLTVLGQRFIKYFIQKILKDCETFEIFVTLLMNLDQIMDLSAFWC